MTLPLEGVRVLDLTIFQQGPYSTTMLADLGADVIKIEGPDSPDPGRGGGMYAAENGYNAYWEAHNRNKRGIVLDLKQEAGRAVLHRLVEGAEVLVSNMRSRALKRLGADYETVSAINPAIIYGRGSGYGPKGPDRDAPSMDIMGQARGGIMSVTGEPDDPPLQVGAPQADQVGAMNLAFGIMVALFHRQRTGEGQQVDASLLGGQIAMQSARLTLSLFNYGKPAQRLYRAGNVATWNVYKGSDDKWFVIGMNRDALWPGICKVIGKEEWLTDERFGPRSARRQNGLALIDEMDKVFAARAADEWVRAFTEADLMAARVNDYGELAQDPQALANGYIADFDPGNGREAIKIVGSPVVFSKTPAQMRRLAPEFGQQTEEVLLEAGYTWDELVALREAGVIGTRIEK